MPFFYPVQSNEALNEHIKFDFRSLKFGLKWSLVWTGHLTEKSDQSNGVDLWEKSHSMDVLLTFHDIIWSQRLQVQSLLQAKFCIEIFFQAVKLDIDSRSTLKQYFFSVIWIWKLFQDHCKNFFKAANLFISFLKKNASHGFEYMNCETVLMTPLLIDR